MLLSMLLSALLSMLLSALPSMLPRRVLSVLLSMLVLANTQYADRGLVYLSFRDLCLTASPSIKLLYTPSMRSAIAAQL